MLGYDEMDLGITPSDEEASQLGADSYSRMAQLEARAFIAQIKRQFGEPPAGAELRVKRNAHDFGTYYSVVVAYDSNSREAVHYAFQCEEGVPIEWDERAREYLASAGYCPASSRPSRVRESERRYGAEKLLALKIDSDPAGDVAITRVLIPGDNNGCLEALQSIVGGYIEAVPRPDDGILVYVNEEGLLKQLPLTVVFDDGRGYGVHHLHGPVVITGVTRGGNTRALDETEVARVRVEGKASSRPCLVIDDRPNGKTR